MKRFLCLFLLIALTGAASAFAIPVKFTPPQFKLKPGVTTGLTDEQVNDLNNQLKSMADDFETEINKMTDDFDIDPKKMTGAFGTSSVYSSGGATQRGYGGYKKFAVTLGPMLGFKLPSSPFDIIDDFENLSDDLLDKGDIELGLDPQAINAQIGINAGFLLDNLYLGLKVGFFKLPDMNIMDGLDIGFGTFSLGLMANYQLLPRINIPSGVILWRGVNVGAGLIYQRTTMNAGFALDDTIGGDDMKIELGGDYYVTPVMTPIVSFDFGINSFTIPLEATTSVRLLWFLNLTAGAGVDIGFGSADMKLGGKADIDFTGNAMQYVDVAQAASLSADIGAKGSPSIFNPKLMAGVGFSLGPVLIDIPVTYYFSNGYNVGVTIGVAW